MNEITLSDVWLSYAAGFIDGEGCIHISKDCYGVTVTNTNPAPLEWLMSHYAGSIRTCVPKNTQHRICYRWTVTGKSTIKFFRDLRPYLKVKGAEADMVIEYSTLRKNSVRKSEIISKLSELKRIIIPQKDYRLRKK